MNTQKFRKQLSSLLAKENGRSIAVCYKDIKTPYKSKYISYNNIQKLMVYSIVIIDYNKWIDELSKIHHTPIKIFEYYGFNVSNDYNWIII